jgi:hypothetical protein
MFFGILRGLPARENAGMVPKGVGHAAMKISR